MDSLGFSVSVIFRYSGVLCSVKFVMTVRKPLPFLIGGACCFRWVSRLGPYWDESAVGNVTNVVCKYSVFTKVSYLLVYRVCHYACRVEEGKVCFCKGTSEAN